MSGLIPEEASTPYTPETMRFASPRTGYRRRPTPRETLVRTMALVGLVLIVGGTALGLRALIPRAPLGTGPRPAHALDMYVTELQTKPKAPGEGGNDVLLVRLEGGVAANYPRMDASTVDAKFAIFAKPAAHDCCVLPRRITWHDDSTSGEIALPMTYVPSIRADVADVDFDGVSQLEISKDEAAWLWPLLLTHAPVVATIDVGAPDRPQLYDLRPATDAEIAAHRRARALANRP